jgi:hypothetical protein
MCWFHLDPVLDYSYLLLDYLDAVVNYSVYSDVVVDYYDYDYYYYYLVVNYSVYSDVLVDYYYYYYYYYLAWSQLMGFGPTFPCLG